MKTRVAAIVGPTAVGKTEIAVAVAERLGAEIVSVDSMQMYRGMDIGTAKAPPSLRARVRHHLLDVVDPADDLTVARFQRLTRGAIADVARRGRVPLLVGGSGLYFRAAVDDLRFPPRAHAVRARLEDEAARVGAGPLHERLRALDPEAAARIDPANTRRIVRALEVVEATGRPFSQGAWTAYESVYELRVAGLRRPRPELFARIEARVDEMFAAGFVDEVRALAASGIGRTARQALGYRQVLEAPPDPPLDAVKRDIVAATRRFARRQESWFSADPRVAWFDAGTPDVVAALTVYLGGGTLDG